MKKVESVPIGPVKTVLTRVCQLFGLSHVRDNAGDWLGTMTMDQVCVCEQSLWLFSPSRVTMRDRLSCEYQLEAVNSSILKLLDVLRPDAVTLVDAFEFPDSALNSALGKYDGNVYEALYRVREILACRVDLPRTWCMFAVGEIFTIEHC